MNQTRYAVFTFTLILVFSSSSLGVVIFVDNQLPDDCIGTYSIANRDNSGSDGDAYNTPQEAADVVNPGDIVYFREGTYYQHESLALRATVMTILRSGTVDNPIVFTNYINEEVILSGAIPNYVGHYYTVVLGVVPLSSSEISGQGVQNIIIDGLIIEGAHWAGLMMAGPANRNASAENPTENVTVRNCIFRYNGVNTFDPPTGGSPGGGFISLGKVVNVLVEDCEAYGNHGTSFSFAALYLYEGEDWHAPEPDDDMSAAQHSVIRNCLVYNNAHPTNLESTDGMGVRAGYNCTLENNVIFNNGDDGIDTYASIGTKIRSNIIFNHNQPEPGDGNAIKFSAGGGGTHILTGNIVFNNKGRGFEGSVPSRALRPYLPSKIYGNLAAYNGLHGIALADYDYTDLTYPGFDKTYLKDNIFFNNTLHDVKDPSGDRLESDYNYISNTQDLGFLQYFGHDSNSLTGYLGLFNPEIVIDTNFDPAWSIEVKLNYIRSQVKAA